MDIKVPNLAEGISSGTVVSILVSEGESVKKDQSVMELETEKAVAPIPSPIAGTVTKIYVAEGDAVTIGQKVMSLSAVQGSPAPQEEVPAVPATPLPAQPPTAAAPAHTPSGFPPPASPAVRKMARELGVDLTRVVGSEKGGRITAADVRAYMQSLQQGGAAVAAKPQAVSVDFSKFGPVRKESLSALRKKISEKMSASWEAVVHVTQFDEANVSRLTELRKKYVAAYEKKKVRLTLTGFILKAVVKTLQKHPLFNASLDEVTQEVVFKDYYNLGLAVDTEQGLMVPVIRDVQKKDLVQLSKDIVGLAKKTRDRKVSLADLRGGSFTISNQGGIGGAHFTPIVNYPEVAILGIGQGKLKPIVRDEKVVSAVMMPLCVSYDHRLIDGAHAARFIGDLVQELENFDEKEVKL